MNRRKVYNSCAVPGCNYQQPQYTPEEMATVTGRTALFQFPAKRSKLVKWLDQIGCLTTRDIKKHSKICDSHFDPKFVTYRRSSSGAKDKRKVLVPHAVPTLNLSSQENSNPNVETVSGDQQTQPNKKTSEGSDSVTVAAEVPRQNSTTTPRKNAVVRLDSSVCAKAGTPAAPQRPTNVIEYIDLAEDHRRRQDVDDKTGIVLMPTPESDSESARWKLPPPAPTLKIARLEKGIRLIWKMNLTDDFAEIAWYELFACKVGTPSDKVASWRKIGEVQAFSLPMSCDLLGQAFAQGKNCLFSIRAVDAHSRFGAYSNTCVL